MRPIIAAVLIFASFQSLDCQSGTTNSRLNYFDIDLLRYVAEGKSGNVMVSPASIKSTLAMLLEGARGTTAAEIKTALRLMPNEDDYRHQLNVFMKDLQVNTSNVFVQNANGLFVSKKLPLKKEYEMMAKRLYFSEVNNLDFNDPRTAADIINGWVSTKTKGLIPNIIDQAHITPRSELVVTNALYFKGTWMHKFDSRPADCFYKDSLCRKVAMMELDAELNYAYVDNLRAHALELPYQGNRYSMILLVPSDLDAGVALIRDLPYIGLLQISSMMRPSDVILTMPKFTVEFGADLVPALKSMQITTLFSPAANLSRIFEDPKASGHLNSIFHKVYMQVDETGTVAAAASAGQVVPLINSFVNLRIDRPFLFFIWDNEKGVVLFEGKIEEPTEVFDANNKFANNGQQGVVINPMPDPTKRPLTPGGPDQGYSVPIQRLTPIDPNANQNFNSQPTYRPLSFQPIQPTYRPLSFQPIQPIVGQRFNSQPNEPIQTTNQPIPTQPITEPTTNLPTTKSTESVKGKPTPDLINSQLSPDGPAFNYYIPVYQFYPTYPIVDQNVTNQPIQSANQPISLQPVQPVVNQPANSQPNQPISDQPVQPVVNQPVNSQPNQPISVQPVQPVVNQPVNSQPNQFIPPIHPTTQPIPTKPITEPPTTSAPISKKSETSYWHRKGSGYHG